MGMLSKYKDTVFTVNVTFIDFIKRLNVITEEDTSGSISLGGVGSVVCSAPSWNISSGAMSQVLSINNQGQQMWVPAPGPVRKPLPRLPHSKGLQYVQAPIVPTPKCNANRTYHYGSNRTLIKPRVDLLQVEVPYDVAVLVGGKLAPKLAYSYSSTTEEKLFLQVALVGIKQLMESRFSEFSDKSVYVEDSIIHFEVFDVDERIVFSPMDLLHPSSLDYESGKCFFTSERYAHPLELEDEHGKFILLKTKSDFTSFELWLVSTLNVYTARTNSDSHVIQKQTTRSLFAGLPNKYDPQLDPFWRCNLENSLRLFVNINSED
jgi:hypothetical protein